MYIYTRREWRNGVNGQSATYQLGNQWYRLPARSNVRHAVDGAVERIVAWMSETEKISEAASARICERHLLEQSRNLYIFIVTINIYRRVIGI